MLSLTEGPVCPPCPAPFNLAAHVLTHADTLGDRIALQIVRPAGAERWSYARLAAAVRGVAGGLLSWGLEPGDRLLFRLGNGVEFPIFFLGAVTAGVVPVVCSSQLTEAEITRIAGDIRPRAAVAGDGVSRPRDLPVIAADALRLMERHAPAPFDLGDPDRSAYIIYTSGTSGQPRAVLHAHRAIWARRMMLDDWSGLGPNDRLLHAGAMNWTYTLGTGLLDPWSVGATALVPGPGVKPDQLPLLLKRFDATIFAAAPGIYRQMLKGGIPLALPKLRHGLSAGEKLPDATRVAWTAATGLPIHEALGLSECSTFISASPARPAPSGTVGFAQPGRRVAILGSDGSPVRRGGEGTIAVHRSDPGLFLTYADAPQEAASRYHGDWFLTGDRGRMAQDGSITYLGRCDDMMNAGGFRVSPVEVEAALESVAGVDACAAIEAQVGPETSVIALFFSGSASEDALRTMAESRLARYKQPRIYIRRDALPRTATGKINRRALRADWESRH